MTATAREPETLRRQFGRAIAAGDHVAEMWLRARLCGLCGLHGEDCASTRGQRRSCRPLDTRAT